MDYNVKWMVIGRQLPTILLIYGRGLLDRIDALIRFGLLAWLVASENEDHTSSDALKLSIVPFKDMGLV